MPSKTPHSPKKAQSRKNLLRNCAVFALMAALVVPASAQNGPMHGSTHSNTQSAVLRIRVEVVPIILPPGKRKKDDAASPVSYTMDTHPEQIEVSEQSQIFQQDVRTGKTAILKTTTVVPQ